MDAKTVIRQVKEQKGEICQVYWVACGGSLVDLYPAHCMLMAESTIIESGIYTSKEFILSTPKKLGKNSVVDIKDYYLIMLFYVEIDYILGVIGTFITRFINNFWVSSMIGYVLYVIGFALAFIVMIKGIKWFVIPFLLILAIIVSIGIVVFGMKKLE